MRRYPGVVDVSKKLDIARGIDPGNVSSRKVFDTKQGGYIKNPTAVKLSDIVSNGKIGGAYKNVKAQYVVDSAGDVYVGLRSGKNMPHPTLLGGLDPQVQAAGIVEIRKGKIVRIDNASGHFRPPRSSLRKAIKAFGRLPKAVFKNLQALSIHHKAGGKEYYKRFRSLRMLKLKNYDLRPALKRIRMRWKHDPRFRGRIKNIGMGGSAIIATILVQYLLGKWLADVQNKQIRKDVERLAPLVEVQLTQSMMSQADSFDDMMQNDPNAEVHMNVVYRVGYWREVDPDPGGGVDETYYKLVLQHAEFSASAAKSGVKFEEIEQLGCSPSSIRWDTMSVSQAVKLKDLAE